MTASVLSSYSKINIILFIVLTGVLGYFALFSPAPDTHPIPCIHEQLTGQSCPTCGLSRSFSSMIWLNFLQAELWNPLGPHLFLFFFVQWIFRIAFLLLALRLRLHEKPVLITDIVLSAGIFFYAYIPLIRILFRY